MSNLATTHLELSYPQLCTLRWALETDWRQMTAHHAACLRQRDENPADAELWTNAAGLAAERLADIEAIVAQFPEPVRKSWAADRAAEAEVSAA